MRISALCLILAAAFASADIYQKWGHDPDIDPLGKHCFDITVDLSDPRGVEWKNGNEWKYTSWKDGLCDNKTWPVVEEDTHLDGISSVTFRKSGHKAAGNATTELAWAGASKDCRTDKTSKPTSIDFTNAAKDKTKIRGCQNQYACKPYVDCELDLAPGASETIVIDSSFKYFIFTFYNAEESELYPDYNMKYPAQYSIKEPTVQALADEAAGDDYVIYQESPGNHAHCTQISFSDGKNNPYYKAHGYQYQPPVWTAGACPAKYNWFNKNETIAPGVVESLRGVHTAEAPLAMVGDDSVYCMNDPTKSAPYYCHVPPLPSSCKTDKDCTTPWYQSYCMNDASKTAPYECKIELPPKCTTDKDCQR